MDRACIRYGGLLGFVIEDTAQMIQTLGETPNGIYAPKNERPGM